MAASNFTFDPTVTLLRPSGLVGRRGSTLALMRQGSGPLYVGTPSSPNFRTWAGSGPSRPEFI